jgi:hypothetical protein
VKEANNIDDSSYSRRDGLIIFLIYISIFINSKVLFKKPFEFYIGYFIYLFLLPVFIPRYGFNKKLLLIFLTLLFSGVLSTILGHNTFGQFLKIFLGVIMSYLFYDYVYKEFDFKIKKLFQWYLIGCYYAAVIGIIQFISYQLNFEPGYNYRWLLNKWSVVTGGNFGIRVNSIFGEPTYLAAVLSASFFVSLYNLFQTEPVFISKLKSTVIIVVYILSFSGLGQIGIILTAIFLAINFGLIRYIFLAIPAFLLLFNVMYDNISEFRDRYDSLIELFGGGEFKLGKTHGSSFVLYNNFVVATENFKLNPILGSGLGSHPVAFEKYSIAKDIKVHGFNLNSADANSMFLRLMSETGLFGLTIFAVIIIKGYVKRDERYDTHHWLISNAILVMILLNMFRQGHYFLNGFPFFVLMYIYNAFSYNKLLTGEKENFKEEDNISEPSPESTKEHPSAS